MDQNETNSEQQVAVSEEAGESTLAENVAFDDGLPPEISVDVSIDNMKAFVSVNKVTDGLKLEPAGIMSKITEAGVCFGINDEAIQQFASSPTTERFEIASGISAEHGKDAAVQVLYAEEGKAAAPKIMDDGSVDLRDVGNISNVNLGDKLLQKIPAEEGTPGKNVKGVEIPAKKGKDAHLHPGKNTKLSEDGLVITATAAGRPVFLNKRIRVEPVYHVKGNVDYSTGNIEFVGSVVVRGWVRDGFSVKAAGDIIIDQGVDGAYLEAGGNVTIRYGFQGGDKGRIRAGGTVKASYITNAIVFAGGDISVRESIMHSKVYADKRVILEGGKSLIVGGLARAGDVISARNVGSSLAQPTSIEVGITPAMREEIHQLEDTIQEKTKELDQTGKAINGLEIMKKRFRRLPPEKEKMLIKLRLTSQQIEDEINDANERKEALQEQLVSIKNPKVKVSGIIYPGVKISIKNSHFNVYDQLRSVTIYEKNKEIVVGPY